MNENEHHDMIPVTTNYNCQSPNIIIIYAFLTFPIKLCIFQKQNLTQIIGITIYG